MNKNRPKKIKALFAGIATVGALVVPTVGSGLGASAAQCTLTTDTQSGVSCGDPSGSGTIGGSGSGGSGGTAGGGCIYSADSGDLPDSFWEFTKDYAVDTAVKVNDGTLTRRIYTNDDNEITGEVETFTSDKANTYYMWAANYSIKGIRQIAGFDCTKSAEGWSWEVGDNPFDELAGPGGPGLQEKPDVTSTSWMAPLPGKPNEYLLRIDLNNITSTDTDAVAIFSKNSWKRVSLQSGPTGVSCAEFHGLEQCSAPRIASGTTQTLVFHVVASDPSATSLPVDVISGGRVKWTWSTARPTVWTDAPVPTRLTVTVP